LEILNRNPLHLVNVHLVLPAIVELVVRVEAWFAMAAAVRPFLWYGVIPVARKGDAGTAAPMRANESTISAISARSRNPHGLRRSRRAHAPDGALTGYFRIIGGPSASLPGTRRANSPQKVELSQTLHFKPQRLR
jgi:hypothetical protein